MSFYPGTYSLGGTDSCTQCDPGYSCDGDRAGQTICDPGYYALAGSDSCTVCGTGNNMSLHGAKWEWS